MTVSPDKPAHADALAERLAKLTPQQRELLLRNLAQRNLATSDQPKAEEAPAAWPRAPVGTPLPLSPAQQQIWVFERLQPGTPTYHIYDNADLHGALDLDALRGALRTIVERHDALRLGFSEDAGRPMQTIHAQVEADIEWIDLQSEWASEGEAALLRAIDRCNDRPFDLARPPLLRMTVLHLANEHHVMAIAMHHIMSDAWSIVTIREELTSAYNALRAGRTPHFAGGPTIQYCDVVLRQGEPQQQKALQRQLDYWRGALSGTSGLLDLPIDRPRGAVITANGAHHAWSLPAALALSVAECCRSENVTAFMLYVAAFHALLARYSGDHDIVVGTPVSNRPTVETESIVGLFVNTIALRGDLSGDLSFRDLLARTQRNVLDALENSLAPMERVIDQLSLERAPGRTPLFQTMFVLQNSMGAAGLGGFDGVQSKEIESVLKNARFEITLSVLIDGSGVNCKIDYNTDLFLPQTIARFAEHYTALLREAIAKPHMPLSRLRIIDDRGSEELLAIGDGGPAQIDASDNLYALFAAQAASTPQADALVEPGRSLSYAETAAFANGLGQRLRALGIGREAIVAVLSDRSCDAVLGVLGTLAAGAAYLPLDPASPDQRLAYLLQDAGARALLVPAAQRERADALLRSLRAHSGDAPSFAVLHINDVSPSEDVPAIERRSDDAAYLIYTSGSSGQPKGVLIEHRGAVNLVRGFLARHDFAQQRLLMIPPLIFDASVGDIFPALASGSALVLHPSPTELGPAELERFCDEHRVSAIDAPAALWRRWCEGLAARPGSRLPHLRLMMIGGESVPVDQVRRFAEITERRAVLCNHYGPTEASVCATLHSTVDGSDLVDAASLDLPIGRPLPGVRVYVLDTHRALCPRGVVGELYIGGLGVARGYLGADVLTAERFLPDPFVAHPFAPQAGAHQPRMYRTGDLVRWNADGTLQFIGRRDHQIKLRGVRIELGEIDAALCAISGIHAATTLLREDRPGDKRLIAYVVADAGVVPMTLRAGLAQRLPESMMPSAYVFLKHMPLNANGKVDRRALPAPTENDIRARAIVAPQTATEISVLAVWRDVLGRESLSTDDDFFAVGGDSLATLPLVFKLHAATGVELPLSEVFATPTVIGLARTIDRIRSGGDIERLDLHSKVVLPPSVSAAHALPPAVPAHSPKSVLLTGATGFLGAYILRELLDVTSAEMVCLVRAEDAADGLRRIRQNLQSYRLWRDSDEDRLHPVLGDLASPRLGLSEADFVALSLRVDAIVHNGGQVNFIAHYGHLEAANVNGTAEVLTLATMGTLKPVQLVSTLGVYLTRKHAGKTVHESDPPPDAEGQYGGYNQSKWVSEQLGLLARSRGVPVAIHRPARITGDGDSGISNTGDYFNAWIRGCVQLGKAPYTADDFFDMTPVDYVARTIVRVMLGAGDPNGQYHYFNPRTLPITDAVATIREFGLPMEEVSYPQWREALLAAVAAGEDNALKPFAGMFHEATGSDDRENDLQMPRFDCGATEAVAARFGIHCLPADRALFARYLKFLQSRGALPTAVEA
jgi:myxalamid-type nonribosomal peptide synthetase MxaA